MTDEFRSEWEDSVTWSEGVFNSLERFVDTKPESDIKRFAQTGDLDDLYGDKQRPSPPPSQEHQEYMKEYAQHKVEN
jgi:hypothetical protein